MNWLIPKLKQATLLAAAVFVSVMASAQTVALLDSTAVLYSPGTLFLRGINWHCTNGVPLSHTYDVPDGSDGRAPAIPAPTPKQFQGTVLFGGVTSARASGNLVAGSNFVANAQNINWPRAESNGVTVLVLRAQVAAPYAARQVSFLFGQVIVPPIKDENGALLTVAPTVYWLSEPHTTDGHTNYYWSPHAKKVFANQVGPLEITWKKAQPTNAQPSSGQYIQESGLYYTLKTERYIISGAPAKTPKKIYWTQGPFAQTAAPIVVPTARVKDVQIAYNRDFPASVTNETVLSGEPSFGTNGITNTLWFNVNASLSRILAYNIEGRVLVELLGDVVAGNERHHLGYEIVDVLKDAVPSDATVELGEPLRAGQEDHHLFPEVITTLSHNGTTFTYPQLQEGSGRYIYWSTAETKNPNDLMVHWKVPGEQGILWPLMFLRYKATWPRDESKYSHYVRPVVPNEEEAKKTAVQLPAENAPFLEYYDPDAQNQKRCDLTEKYAFYSYLDSNFPAQRALIRYSSGNKVAFERIFSWLDANLKTTNFVGTVATNLNGWNAGTGVFTWNNPAVVPRVVRQTVDVGQRIPVPDGELGSGANSYWAGYINPLIGTNFNPNAYINPFESITNSFDAANAGAIIPVNAIPGKEKLDVWWFRRNQAQETDGFKPTYWPSVIGHYTVQWPGNATEIILASNEGGGPLESLEATGNIYVQNDLSKPGYNPNEEHALILGGTVYALRDDLNITSNINNEYSSAPFVLLEYRDADGRLNMRAFKVRREKPEAGILFDYITVAGSQKPIEAPMPLPLLPPPVEQTGLTTTINYNTEPPSTSGDLPAGWNAGTHGTGLYSNYARFTYEDRKHDFRVYRGFHAGLPILQAGTYNANSGTFGAMPTATAIVNQDFTHVLHVSRREESLVLTATNLPAGLSVSGLKITGSPTAAGNHSVTWTLRDNDDDSSVGGSFSINVMAAGTTVAQGPLQITSTNQYSRTNVTYLSRPPFLASPAAPSNSFTMRFYYKTQPGFAWPGIASPPAVGSIVPYLRPKDAQGNFVGDAAAKTTPAQDIVYRPVWPSNVPKLNFGESLMTPKRSLPDVRGQTSLKILYQQSIGTNFANGASAASVVLHDPTHQKSYALKTNAADGLHQLPPSIESYSYQGKSFFPNLPPHLAQRFFFDPTVGGRGSLILQGEFKDEITGEDWLLLNVLRGSDLAAVKGLCPATDLQNKTKWDAAIDGLIATVETFHENPSVPGTYIPNASLTKIVPIGSLIEVTSDETAVDSYALSASGPGTGYVTLIGGNGEAFTEPGDPVTLYVIKVTGTLYPGEVRVVPSSNPLSEMITFQHTADLAGRFSEYEYEWKKAPPVSGEPPETDATMSQYSLLTTGLDVARYTLGGSGIDALVDNYVVMRYRPKTATHPFNNQWSDWTTPKLAEGWIKRVVAGINPFNQRLTDLFNNSVNTDVSLLTQAGGRWEGDIALNLENINDHGLIAIYETVLNRGKDLSINAGINFGPANDALLLAAGYLNDLYMILGNEAWADASNPTIGIGTAGHTYSDIATALFSFKGQVPSLLEEELVLLRGRDDFLTPSVGTKPVYNRLYWNYTRGIDSGEVIYALNYNIQENPNQTPDGIINAADAARMFPQGHGDAYGHYLTALKGYYSLLMNTKFDWIPRSEAVTVLGQSVQIDYQDERKFAAAAVAVARTGRQIFDLTWRKDYQTGGNTGWDESFAPARTNMSRALTTACIDELHHPLLGHGPLGIASHAGNLFQLGHWQRHSAIRRSRSHSRRHQQD